MHDETNTAANQPKSRRPDFTAFAVRERGDLKARWTEVGVAFRNRDGSLSVLLDAVPLVGKIILREPDAREEA